MHWFKVGKHRINLALVTDVIEDVDRLRAGGPVPRATITLAAADYESVGASDWVTGARQLVFLGDDAIRVLQRVDAHLEGYDDQP